MNQPEVYLPTRLRSLARIVRAERKVEAATKAALEALAAQVGAQLAADGYTGLVADNRAQEWREALATQIMPAIADVYDQGFRSEYRGDTAITAAILPGAEEPLPYSFGAADHLATQYLLTVHNRMIGVADDVFARIAAALEEGRQAQFTLEDGTVVTGESIPQLAARVDALLTGNTTWTGDAVRVARTEVISANNAGAEGAAYGNAELFGVSSTAVLKSWLNTHDHRTRPAHQDQTLGGVGGQVVLGMDTVFSNGLQRPGDPSGPAGQTINCRCTALYHYPGDPGYDDMLAAAGLTALTAAADQEDPMTEPTPEAPMDGPTHAGLAVQALDTGRILMMQRALDPEDPAAGKWEFPGGSIDPGETPLDAARREWTEETGMLAPTADPVGGWTSPDGVYEAFVVQVDAESDLALNPDAHAGDGNPDDPEREAPEVTCWLSQEDIAAMGDAIRQEVRDGTQWDEFVPTVMVPMAEAVTAGAQFGKHGGKQNQYDGPGGGKAASPAAKAAAGQASKEANADSSAADKSLSTAKGHPSAKNVKRAKDVAKVAANSHDRAATKNDAAGNKGQATKHRNKAKQLRDDAGKLKADRFYAGLEASDAETMPPEATGAPVGAEQPPALAQDIPEDGDPWHGILAPEDVVSGDNRMFGAESIIARDLPLPLMYQDAQQSGHDGSVRVGRIDHIWRDTTRYNKPMIRYSGVWDTSPIAQEAQRQVEARILRGVSIDGDQVTASLIGSDGQELDPMADMAPEDGVVIEKCVEARVSGGTLCSVPAFQQAYIANGIYDDTMPEPGQDEVAGVVHQLPDTPDALVAAPAWSLVASADAWVLPTEHFANPNLTEPTSLTVDEDGRVYGHLATWGQCHLNGAAGQRGEQVRAAGKCMEVPTSASNYAYFATGIVHTDDGGVVNVGQLTMGTPHANLRYGALDAMGHYDNTGTVVADVTVGHDTVGIWFSGHLRPDATQAQVHALTASGSVSGDWREVVRRSNQLELVAALVVNVPGYPIGRPQATRTATGTTALVASGAIDPGPADLGSISVSMSDEAVADFATRVMAHMARTERVGVVRARARTQHATALVERLTARSESFV